MQNAVHEPRWHAGIAVVVALALYVTLPPRVLIGPLWALPAMMFVTLVPLLLLSPHRHEEAPWQRVLSIVHILILNAFNVGTVVLLVDAMLHPARARGITGEDLLFAAVQIWCTNVIVYALWFWEVDCGGPDRRAHATLEQRTVRGDFSFPQQMLQPEVQQALQFRARFLDYLFLAFTNATAFSPTDTFPLTHRAKVLMMLQAMTSLVTIAVIAGRAVNILGG